MSGEKSSVDGSQPSPQAQESTRPFEDQIREAYGRVVYSHKTHSVCADMLAAANNRLKLSQIVLSAVSTAGFVGVIFTDERWVAMVGGIVAVLLLILNAYTKDFDLGAAAQKHREAASDMWDIRERYLSLMTDLQTSTKGLDHFRSRRDTLHEDLHTVYKAAPGTSPKAYGRAQQRLQKKEDMTFNEGEIDAFLPPSLKRQTSSARD